MLIGLANRTPRSRAEHQQVIRHIRPTVPGPVLAQVWRGNDADTPLLARYLRDCHVRVDCSERDYRRVGVLLGRASLPAKKRPDVVDALVAVTAAEHGDAAVLTSDPRDISGYLDALPGANAVVIPV